MNFKTPYKTLTLVFIISIIWSCNTSEKQGVTSFIPKISIAYDTLSSHKKVSCIILINDTLEIKGKIKQKGGSSVGYAKKSYTVKFKKKLNYFGNSKSKKWIFNASYIDKSLMRNKLCYDLFKNFRNENVAPSINFIEFYHANDYQGIYQLTEKIDQKSLGFSKDYQGGMIFKDCPVFTKGTIKPQEEDSYYQQNYPSIKKVDYTLYMDTIKDFILNSSDKYFSENIELMFDIDNIIDWQLIILLSNSGDAVYKNFYLYKKDKNSKFKIAIWDYDSSLGRDADNELNMMKTTSHWERNTLLNRLYNSDVNNYQERLKLRWNQLRNEGKISVIDFEKRVDSNVAILRPFLEHNFEKWPVTDTHYWDSYNFDQEIKVLKDFVELRINQLDEKFNYNGL